MKKMLVVSLFGIYALYLGLGSAHASVGLNSVVAARVAAIESVSQ